ncbi:hypothetical protein QVD17_02623 [Tagetes erecta]|uniref:Uncharacterized protein n=1 Tax=Tagetes erecta TaxID=13708 RepID=A0AAD8L9T3_TARER|nr:hypothetical protein QVD17_02623 [Tagetes erecta]
MLEGVPAAKTNNISWCGYVGLLDNSSKVLTSMKGWLRSNHASRRQPTTLDINNSKSHPFLCRLNVAVIFPKLFFFTH